MNIRLDNKVALITGGGKGIGQAVALSFAESGADIVICDIDFESAERTASQVKQLGRRALALRTNVAESAECQRMVDETVEAFGHLDVLVNNAGISHPMPSVTMTPEIWNSIISIDLNGVFFASQATARQMIKQGGGAIISLSSMAGRLGFAGRAPYCAAKAGVIALTQVFAVEWAEYNIRVNAVAPGYINTELVEKNVARGMVDIAGVTHRTPMKRLGTPEEVASVIVLLASEQMGYVTGETIGIDGGWVANGGW
jgi:NAD(P)-dependent dehydrogenase (short-subunit alcohol dehydrogenase family)